MKPVISASDLPRKPSAHKIAISPIQETKPMGAAEVASVAQRVMVNVERVIVGKHDQVQLAMATMLAEGHLLIEDVPGTAKTMLARAIAQSVGGTFKRIQCTPDLEPVDVLGEPFTVAHTGQVEYKFGPLFANVVLVDEINRASPRTQASMLEAMVNDTATTE